MPNRISNAARTSIVRATFDLPPLGNRYWRLGKHGRLHLSSAAKIYKDTVGWTARGLHLEPVKDNVKVSIDVYRKAKRGDLDGYAKVLLDAMQGYLYVNDKQIVELNMRRFDDKQHPRVEVRVQVVK